MSKKYAVFITVLFCAFLGAFAVANALTPDREFSPMENRYLAQRPTLDRRDFTLSWSAAGTGDFFSGKFMSDFERYVTDQFVGRDGWIAAKAAAEKLSGKGENNGVYLCKKETLIPRFDRPDARRVTDNLNYVNKLVEHVDIPVYFALIPGKVSVWADRLPEGAPNADESAILREAAAASRARWVDVQGALLAHAGEDIYYRLDHHWTSLGAFYGANAILSAMGREPLDLTDYTPITVSDSFYGTIFSTSGVRWVPPDSIEVYVTEDGVSVTSYPKGEPEPGKLYDASYLTKKNQYAYFLGGNQPLCVVRSGKPGAEGKLLLVRDSYADSLTPFLTERFREIHLIDLRYYRASLQDYIRENGIDEIMVLYGYSSFTTDRNLFLLAK